MKLCEKYAAMMKNAVATVAVFALSAPVLAANTTGGFASMTANLNKQMSAGGKTLVSLSFLIGLSAVFVGGMEFWKESREPGRDHMKKGFVALAVGALFVGLPEFVKVNNATFMGDAGYEADDFLNGTKSAASEYK